MVQEAKGLRDAGLLRGGSFGAMLGEWVAGEGGLAPPSAQAMATEAERLLRSADRAAWQRSSFRHKAALYVLLSGDRRVAEHLLRVNPLPSPKRAGLLMCRMLLVASSSVQKKQSSRVGILSRKGILS